MHKIFSSPPPSPPPSSAASRRDKLRALASQLHLASYAAAFLGLAGLCTAIAAAEFVFTTRTANPLSNPLGVTPTSEALKGLTTALTALLLLCIGVQYHLKWRLRRLAGAVLPLQHFYESQLCIDMLMEIAFGAVHCPAGCYALWRVANVAETHTTYDADSIISCLMFLRLQPWLLLLLRSLTGFDTVRALVVQTQTGVQLDAMLAVRYVLKRKPVVSSVCVYLTLVASASYFMKVAERGLCFEPETLEAGFCPMPAKGMHFTVNAFWLILVTSMTVGYGDLFPWTHLGRLIGAASALLGLCVIALLVSAVDVWVKLDVEEKRATEMLAGADARVARRKLAGAVVRDFLRFAARSLRGSPRLALIRGLARATFPWNGGMAKAGWVQWKALPPAAKATLSAAAMNPISKDAVQPLFASLRKWQAHQKQAALRARRAKVVDVIRDDIADVMVRRLLAVFLVALLHTIFSFAPAVTFPHPSTRSHALSHTCIVHRPHLLFSPPICSPCC